LPRQGDKFFYTGSNGAFRRLIPEPALLTLPMTLFSGTTFTCQKKTPNNIINLPRTIYTGYKIFLPNQQPRPEALTRTGKRALGYETLRRNQSIRLFKTAPQGFTKTSSIQENILLSSPEVDLRFCQGVLLKIRRTAFNPFTFFTFRKIFDLAVFKNRLHFDFSSAGAKKFLSRAGCPSVFTGLSHVSISLVVM
jgi:hypothetical protein